MKAIKFKDANATFAENQQEYQSLPAHKTVNGETTFCFELDEEELRQVRETGRIWLTVLTFNQPLQPIGATILKPEDIEE